MKFFKDEYCVALERFIRSDANNVIIRRLEEFYDYFRGVSTGTQELDTSALKMMLNSIDISLTKPMTMDILNNAFQDFVLPEIQLSITAPNGPASGILNFGSFMQGWVLDASIFCFSSKGKLNMLANAIMNIIMFSIILIF